MRAAVIGAGAIGPIYSGRFSQHNEVILVDTNQDIVKHINKNGLLIDENDTTSRYHSYTVCHTEKEQPADLVIAFVKALFSRNALEQNRSLIGPDTRLMVLQNGAGHEDLSKEFVSENHIITGTIEDNGAVLGPGHVRHGGIGVANLGMLIEDAGRSLNHLKKVFDSCGFQIKIHDNVQKLIQDKLFTNVSLSALAGIFQVDMGYIIADACAWKFCCQFIHETIEAATAAGLVFDEAAVTEKVKNTSIQNPNGCISIRADLQDGRRTEVDTISGTVVRTAKRYHVAVPGHESVVTMIRAMGGRNQQKRGNKL